MVKRLGQRGLGAIARIIKHPLTWKITGGIAVSLVAGLGVSYWLAEGPKRAIEADQATFLKTFPNRDYNESALKLHELAAPLGIALYDPMGGQTGKTFGFASHDRLTKTRPEATAAQELPPILAELKDYLNRELPRTEGAIAPLPPAVIAYLDRHQATLKAVRQHLTTGEGPVLARYMQFVVESDVSFPLPGFLKSIQLQDLLIAEALLQRSRGDQAAFGNSLEALWIFGQAIRESPYVIGQLVAIIGDRRLFGVLRHLGPLPTPWPERVVADNRRDRLATSVQGENLYLFNATRAISQNVSGNPVLDPVLNPLVSPWFLHSAIESYQANTAERVIWQKEQQGTCNFSNSWTPAASSMPKISWWNTLGQISLPNWTQQLVKAERSMLDGELTAQVLRVGAIAGQGPLPAQLPSGELRSKVCPNLTWQYQRHDDGSATLALAAGPAWLAAEEARRQKESPTLDRPLPLTYRWLAKGQKAKTAGN